MPCRQLKEKRSDTRAHLDESSRSTLSLFLPLFLSRARVPAGACVRACLFGVGAYELIYFWVRLFFSGEKKRSKKKTFKTIHLFKKKHKEIYKLFYAAAAAARDDYTYTQKFIKIRSRGTPTFSNTSIVCSVISFCPHKTAIVFFGSFNVSSPESTIRLK